MNPNWSSEPNFNPTFDGNQRFIQQNNRSFQQADPNYGHASSIPTTAFASLHRGRHPAVIPPSAHYRSPNTNAATTLFVGDISILCNEETIFDTFRVYGEIESVQLKKSERDPQRAHLSYGFVKFASSESASLALQELNGKFLQGRCLRVGWADENGGPAGLVLRNSGGKSSNDQKKNNQTAQIHVIFICKDLNIMVSELNLGSAFGRFGNLVDIAIKKNVLNQDLQTRSGYGFIHYSLTNEGIQSAIRAVEEMNRQTFENITYECKITHSLQAHIFSLKRSNPVAAANFTLPNPSSSFSSQFASSNQIPRAPAMPPQPSLLPRPYRDLPPSYAPRLAPQNYYYSSTRSTYSPKELPPSEFSTYSHNMSQYEYEPVRSQVRHPSSERHSSPEEFYEERIIESTYHSYQGRPVEAPLSSGYVIYPPQNLSNAPSPSFDHEEAMSSPLSSFPKDMHEALLFSKGTEENDIMTKMRRNHDN